MKELLFQKPESMEAMLDQLTPEIVRQIKTAIEIGKWQDGSILKKEHLEHCIQLLILYESHTLPEDARTGSTLESCHSNSAIKEVLVLRDMKNGEAE